MRNEVHSVDPSLAVFDEKKMEDHLTDSLIIPRVESAMFRNIWVCGIAAGGGGSV